MNTSSPIRYKTDKIIENPFLMQLCGEKEYRHENSHGRERKKKFGF